MDRRATAASHLRIAGAGESYALAKDAAARANEKYKKVLQQYQAPELDPAVDEALQDFIARRKGEIEPEY